MKTILINEYELFNEFQIFLNYLAPNGEHFLCQKQILVYDLLRQLEGDLRSYIEEIEIHEEEGKEHQQISI